MTQIEKEHPKIKASTLINYSLFSLLAIVVILVVGFLVAYIIALGLSVATGVDPHVNAWLYNFLLLSFIVLATVYFIGAIRAAIQVRMTGKSTVKWIGNMATKLLTGQKILNSKTDSTRDNHGG